MWGGAILTSPGPEHPRDEFGGRRGRFHLYRFSDLSERLGMWVFLPALMPCAWAMAATVSVAASYVWIPPFAWSTVTCQSSNFRIQDVQVIKRTDVAVCGHGDVVDGHPAEPSLTRDGL
jgi:hypothetical protein